MSEGTDRKPRLVYLLTSMEVGGAEQQARYLARTFSQRGWPVGLISMVPLDDAETELEASGVKVTSLGMGRGRPDLRGVRQLRSILREWRPDILHSLMVHANLLGRASRLLVRTPVVISSIRTPNEGRTWRYIAYRATGPLADCTTAVSQDAIDEAVRRHAAPRGVIRLIPNGIDTVQFCHNADARRRTRMALGLDDEFAWLAVGRLTEAKAYPDLIAAFRVVHDAGAGARLLIAGPGPLRNQIVADIRARGLEGRVALLGQRNDIADLMSAADGFVLSSAWEGMPMALLEAAASSLPIVATRVGANATAIVDETSGFLVRPGEPPELAAAMRRVMVMDADARMGMGAAGRALVKRDFDLDATVDVWRGLYLEMMERRRALRSP